MLRTTTLEEMSASRFLHVVAVTDKADFLFQTVGITVQDHPSCGRCDVRNGARTAGLVEGTLNARSRAIEDLRVRTILM